MGSRLIAAGAVAVGVSVAASVAGGTPASASQASRAARAGSTTSRHEPSWFELTHLSPAALPTPNGLIGAECSSLPRRGPGSRASLAKVPVGTAVEQSPQLSDLARAIRVAGLIGTLNAAHALTVFAADNAGFRVLGQANLDALMTTRTDLARVIKFQIVAGHVTPAELRHRRVLTTLGDTKIDPSRSGTSYYVNGAWIICGNLHTSNATLYIVNDLVIPAG